MNKKSVKLIAVILLAAVVVFEIGFIVKRNIIDSGDGNVRSGIAGAVTVAAETAVINDVEVPAYNITGKDVTYFSDSNLSMIGFALTDTGERYELTYNGVVFDNAAALSAALDGRAAYTSGKQVFAGGSGFECFSAEDSILVPAAAVTAAGGVINAPAEAEAGTPAEAEATAAAAAAEAPTETVSETIVVLDPGHGKSSSAMNTEEKSAAGWVQNSSGEWGEWRHYKSGSSTEDCEGSGCTGRVTPNGSCWYPIGNGDRAVEPAINLNNALAAKRYLEEMGYTVRMTRTTNDENPSITRRISYCYPNNDTSAEADADIFVCIHSNAGGGSGSAYISLEGLYDQRGISSTYVEDSNMLGKYINDVIVSDTSLSRSGNGIISFEPELIAFCKSPVPCGYLEIGFFDNSSDLNILETESDSIGRAIAYGINTYLTEKGQ